MVTFPSPPTRDITGRSVRSHQVEPLRLDEYLFGVPRGPGSPRTRTPGHAPWWPRNRKVATPGQVLMALSTSTASEVFVVW